jgi:hypothetical protein
MKKIIFILLVLISMSRLVQAQHDLKAGLLIRKTEALYWENGVGIDYSSDKLLKKQLVFSAGYVSSRLGNALVGNALKQDNLLLGAHWLFRPEKKFQFTAGINTGVFLVDYEDELFDELPASSLILAFEAGIRYQLKPVSLRLSAGYNLKSGDGTNIPGSLFPLYYQLGVFLPINF